MVTNKTELATGGENRTPSLSVDSLIEQAEKQRKKRLKLGGRKKKDGKPYWLPIIGVLRWEKRQHYYDENGERKTRRLETRQSKPRGKKNDCREAKPCSD